jgi:hypothetical protein
MVTNITSAPSETASPASDAVVSHQRLQKQRHQHDAGEPDEADKKHLHAACGKIHILEQPHIH